MPTALAWVLFALVALLTILGAKALDDRDRRRFGARVSRASEAPQDPAKR